MRTRASLGDSDPMTLTKEQRDLREKARQQLLSLLSPGQQVYGIVRSVARSGASRDIDFYMVRDGVMFHLTAYFLGLGIGSRTKAGAMRVRDACGMEIPGTIHRVGEHLWPNGTPEPHDHPIQDHHGNTAPDHRGGYALRSQTL